MYVCLCHGINEATIRDAVKSGSRTVRELGFQTGCGTQCGSCVPQVQSILVETLRAEHTAGHTPFLNTVSAF